MARVGRRPNFPHPDVEPSNVHADTEESLNAWYTKRGLAATAVVESQYGLFFHVLLLTTEMKFPSEENSASEAQSKPEAKAEWIMST